MGLERSDKGGEERRDKTVEGEKKKCLFGTIDCRIVHQAPARNSRQQDGVSGYDYNEVVDTVISSRYYIPAWGSIHVCNSQSPKWQDLQHASHRKLLGAGMMMRVDGRLQETGA